MTASHIGRTVLVLLLAAPLVVWEGVPDAAPDWLAQRFLGAPIGAWATVGWFVAFILLAWLFSADRPASPEDSP